MKIVIQIPCFNEEFQLEKIINEIRNSVSNVNHNIEIVIIDDGSTDKTADVARKMNVDKIISLKRNMGLGYAFDRGRLYASEIDADILINTDADNQYKSKFIPSLIQNIIETNKDIVIGIRKFDQISHFSKIKKILQKFGSRVVRLISGQKISDASSGFRAYNKRAIKKLQINSSYSYTLETLIQAKEKNLVIGEIPIEINPPSRDSRLFKTMSEFVVKQMLIIFKAFFYINRFIFFLL